MKFVFDLDGTLSFDGVTIDDEIKQVLLRAEEFGHEVAFASARSYRDCLGLLGDSLSQQLVIGLNGGLAYRQGQLVYEEQLDKDVYREVLGFCRHYNLPFFVDDTFDYSGQILEKIPFVANVDPLKKAQYRSLEELMQMPTIRLQGERHELPGQLGIVCWVRRAPKGSLYRNVCGLQFRYADDMERELVKEYVGYIRMKYKI